jgi:homospermidine synthase
MTHGANPGLVSHLVKQALLNIAHDNKIEIPIPTSSQQWAELAQRLDIKAIHIAERDTQRTHQPKRTNEYVNTWSVSGFMSEGSQPAELGWGTHERHMPEDGYQFDFGERCSIYLGRPGASTLVRSWSPSWGPFHGFLITHAESISIASYLTLIDGNKVKYRPTVHYAYMPCPDAILSMHEFACNEWQVLKNQRVIFNEIIDGSDELGVLLMGNKKGAYWYGSTLSVGEARSIAEYNNATTLQVVAGAISGVIWAITNPNEGIVEPEDLDFQFILDIAAPYLGTVKGYYTDWTPLQNREQLFSEDLDHSDPWQFKNIRVK